MYSVVWSYTRPKNDASTGLYYYNARYYDPFTGQFTQPDSMIPDPLNPATWNRFSYVYGNPVNFTDPSGHFGETPLDMIDAGFDLAACAGGDGLSCAFVAYDILAIAIPGLPASYGNQFFGAGGGAIRAARRADNIVVELGTGLGDNLVPIATHHPNALVVGMDVWYGAGDANVARLKLSRALRSSPDLADRIALAVCRRGEFDSHNRQTAINFTQIIV